jgi:predicted protein tyrosine phosphatase
MKIDLTICGLRELKAQAGKPWTHVISIWDKAYLYNPRCRKLVKLIAPKAELIFSFFEDVDDPDFPGAPVLHDVKRILDFTSKLPPKAKVLVHCRAGVSRSTATAYAILCQHTAPGREMENLRHVQKLRELVIPNRQIIRLADRILERGGAMHAHFQRRTK